MSTPVIEVRDLTVSYRRHHHALTAVRDLSFRVDRGEIVAIVGESGSGKTTTAQTLLGLLPSNATIDTGAVLIDGHDLTRVKDKAWRRLRGRVISLVPQDPMVGLNPTQRVGVQIGEAVRLETPLRGPEVDLRVLELLELAGVPEPELRAKQYPHQLSGGLRQRVLIAMALAGEPEVIVADEPTSALDVTVQKVILDHLESLVRERGISLVIITHDLAVAADRADRVIVMQEGQLVEEGSATAVLTAPRAGYTRRLLEAAPALAAGGRIIARHASVAEAPEILRLEGLSKTYQLPRTRSGTRTLTALDDVTLRVGKGQTLGIVGESGSGKTTLLRLALGLEQPSTGRIVFDGRDITGLSWRELRPLRRRFQLVQQNPYASIDPRFTVERAIVEPLVSFGVGSRGDRRRRAADLADLVALPQSSLDQPARELSGGQRQRVAIARALALEPDVIFLDEPVSALDVSVQAQILTLLAGLQESLGLTYVFVSHDLSVVGGLAHHVAVLASGRVVEYGVAEQVLTAPEHDLVRELIAAVPGVRLRP